VNTSARSPAAYGLVLLLGREVVGVDAVAEVADLRAAFRRQGAEQLGLGGDTNSEAS
jgi:hypothetical protein